LGQASPRGLGMPTSCPGGAATTSSGQFLAEAWRSMRRCRAAPFLDLAGFLPGSNPLRLGAPGSLILPSGLRPRAGRAIRQMAPRGQGRRGGDCPMPEPLKAGHESKARCPVFCPLCGSANVSLLYACERFRGYVCNACGCLFTVGGCVRPVWVSARAASRICGPGAGWNARRHGNWTGGTAGERGGEPSMRPASGLSARFGLHRGGSSPGEHPTIRKSPPSGCVGP